MPNVAPRLFRLASKLKPRRIRNDSPTRVRAKFWPMLPEVAIVDVREPKEFAVSHLPGAVNIPVGQMQERVADSIGVQRVAAGVMRSLALLAFAHAVCGL